MSLICCRFLRGIHTRTAVVCLRSDLTLWLCWIRRFLTKYAHQKPRNAQCAVGNLTYTLSQRNQVRSLGEADVDENVQGRTTAEKHALDKDRVRSDRKRGKATSIDAFYDKIYVVSYSELVVFTSSWLRNSRKYLCHVPHCKTYVSHCSKNS